jgi:tripartite-type tricarboxylate transporter receptor subunit TctC
MADRDLQQRLASGGAEVVVSTSPAEYARYVARETQKWEKVVKESGITAD